MLGWKARSRSARLLAAVRQCRRLAGAEAMGWKAWLAEQPDSKQEMGQDASNGRRCLPHRIGEALAGGVEEADAMPRYYRRPRHQIGWTPRGAEVVKYEIDRFGRHMSCTGMTRFIDTVGDGRFATSGQPNTRRPSKGTRTQRKESRAR